MDALRRLFGGGDEPQRQPRPTERGGRMPLGPQDGDQHSDEQAIERYRYLLRTAPPETVEAAHAEAFAQLTPEQRRMVLQELSHELPEQERPAYDDDPRSLARMATRAEMRRPGTLERAFGGMTAPGMGLGGMLAGSFLGSFAGMMIGGAIASHFFDEAGAGLGDPGAADAAPADDTAAVGDDLGADFGGDFGGDF